MNRRNFLKVFAAALAAPVIRPTEAIEEPRIVEARVTPTPEARPYRGYVFMEDPSPMRFVYRNGELERLMCEESDRLTSAVRAQIRKPSPFLKLLDS